MKIADLTTSCGSTRFSQFNRVFNKFCHTSPSQFRVNGIVAPITAIPFEKEPSPGRAPSRREYSGFDNYGKLTMQEK